MRQATSSRGAVHARSSSAQPQGPVRGSGVKPQATGKKRVCSTSTAQEPSRRQLLLGSSIAAAAAVAARAPPPAFAASSRPAGDWTTPGLAVPEDPAAPKFFKTPGGVKVQELAAGAGAPPVAGDAVLIDYTLRRADGYFVYSTVEGVSFQPRDVPIGPVSVRLGDGSLIPGLEEVLQTMAPGARRRALVPPELGYTSGALQPQPPTFATKRQLANHAREPLLFEVQLLRVNGQR